MMTPADFTFDLVINKGDLDCVMCSSDQIKSRTDMYREEIGRVLRLGDLEDEVGDSDNDERGEVKVGTTTTSSTAENATTKDKKKSVTTTAAKRNKQKKSPPPTWW